MTFNKFGMYCAGAAGTARTACAPQPELGDWAELRTAGELGGRLSAALLGQAGLPAQTAAAAAARNCLLYWGHIDEPPAFPAWVLGEAVPGLLGLAGQREAETAARVAAVQALASSYLRRQWAPVKAALESAAAMEALAGCLYQEPFLKELSVATASFLRGWPRRLESPAPLLRSLAQLLPVCRRDAELWAAEAERQRPLYRAQALLIGGRDQGAFSLRDVLDHDGLARELVLAAEAQGGEYFLERLAVDVPLSDARVCLFLCHGGAGIIVRQLRYHLTQALPDEAGGAGAAPVPGTLCWEQLREQVKRLPALLDAGQTGAAAAAVRARLLRDAGLGELRPRLRRVLDERLPEPEWTHLHDEVRSLLDRYDAALAHPVSFSRLPALNAFPDR